MCGILGNISTEGATGWQVARALVEIRHRGPDDEGLLIADWHTGEYHAVCGDDSDARLHLEHWSTIAERPWPLIFGHRRLSILDMSEAGHQPMSWCNGRYWITYNGEVYKYRELRQELEANGCRFVSGTDTEVILAAYEAWGEDCVKRFTGMWAFAIWDVQARVVFLSRDPFGIKPLYYSQCGGHFSFCSEIKGLLELPWIGRRVNPQAAYEYLAWGRSEDPSGATMVNDVREMPPATRATIALDDHRSFRPVKYWDIEIHEPRRISLEDAADEFRALFMESIGLHLRSDVPVGAALSGGIDSTAIVCAMRQCGGPELALHTFSYLADDPALSEEKWMDVCGQKVSACMHKVSPAADELEQDIDSVIRCQDVPFGSTSIYAQHRVFRLASEKGIKVTLDGQGPDEMFAGYFYFRKDRAMSLLGKGNLKAARQMAGLPGGINFVKLAAQFLAPRALTYPLRRMFGRNPVPAWMSRQWLRACGVDAVFPLEELPRRETLRHSLRRSLLESSIPSLLRFEDRNSMHFSIESRVPFLTTALAEAALSLPEEYIMPKNGVTKHLLRRAFRGLVPDVILDRQDKIGFATPESNWLQERKTWVRSVFETPGAKSIPIYNHASIMEQIEGRGRPAAGSPFPLWRILNLTRWHDLCGLDMPGA